ncbi:MAG TPA: AMP-binding protein [Solirubrobacteraceae bacterium]|nr:AMP-binding protein [Solirubrobacteraceae bacterium]
MAASFFEQAVLGADPQALALVERSRSGERREWRFGEIARAVLGLAARMPELGVRRGDVVMTLIGNRPEWVITLLACWRQGYVALPCNEQLRAKDLRARIEVAQPSLIVADERNRSELERAAPSCPVALIPDAALFAGADDRAIPPAVPCAPDEPALITFTSGTAGAPKAVVHGHRYLTGQRLQAEHWLAPRAGELVWCTAASGWSKSARNAFIAPWLAGASALLHDARFDPSERLELLAAEGVNVLCMAPTEYRVIARRAEPSAPSALRHLVCAGEALNPEVLHCWQEATGLVICDGYGQTETGQLTAVRDDGRLHAGSMGRPLPGVRAWVEDGELLCDPRSVPTFCLGYIGEEVRRADGGRVQAAAGGWQVADAGRRSLWRTGDRVREDEEGFLHFEGRADDVIISAGYRIGPFEVESALLSHPAVAEAAAVAAPDPERGSVVRAVVVLREGFAPSEELARALQDHVKGETAPYKYPRIVDFAPALPKTASGKVIRAALRQSDR